MNEIEINELNELVRLAKKFMWSEEKYHEYIHANGVLIEPNRFYSQLASVNDVKESFEYREVYKKNGPYFDEQIFPLENLKKFYSEMAPYAQEFKPPLSGDQNNPEGYFWNNPAFSFLDAIAYYCMIRSKKPKNVLEIGSGFSTLVAKMAISKNGFGNLRCIEPFPRDFVCELLEEKELVREKVQDLDELYLHKALGDNDILFIDSTHTVKIGSDCLYIYLKMLPKIRSKVWIHVHDIPLPFTHSRVSAIEKHVQWVEPYLLLAYMIENQRIEFVFSSRMAHEFEKEKFEEFIGYQKPTGGGSIWFSQSAESP